MPLIVQTKPPAVLAMDMVFSVVESLKGFFQASIIALIMLALVWLGSSLGNAVPTFFATVFPFGP